MNNLENIQRLKQQFRHSATPPSTPPDPADMGAINAMAKGLEGLGGAMASIIDPQNLLIKGTGRLINITQTLTATYINAAKEMLWLEKRNEDLNKTFGLTIRQAGNYGAELDNLSVGFKKGGDALRGYAVNLKSVIGNYKLAGTYSRMTSTLATQLLRTQEIITDSLGLSAEQASNFELYSAGAGKAGTDYLVTTNAIAKDLEEMTGQQGLFKEITGDIADLSADLQIQYSRIPGTLEVATVKSKALGLSVEKLNSAGKNLLNIESSIGQELEYQLLSGRRLVNQQGKSLTNEFRVAQLRGDASKQADLMNQILEQEGETLENNLFAREQMSQLLGMDEATLARSLQKKKILEKIGGEALFDLSGKELFEAAKGLGTSADDLKALAESEDTRSTEKILMDIEDKLITQGVRINIGAGQGDITADLSKQMQTNADNISQFINATGPGLATAVGAIDAVASVSSGVSAIGTKLVEAYYTGGGWKGVIVEMGKMIGGSGALGSSNAPMTIGTSTGLNMPVSRSIGGPVATSKPYFVGEVGPELFVPNTAGNIIPNNKISLSPAGSSAADITSLANAIVAAFQSGVKLEVKIDPTFTGGGMNQGRYSS